ncbi:hypothetical protein J31TS6_60660 [Brevibacillus reuszeri]|uniref:YcdB/YcdC domain-containing protein n=1 Tax=Brevibacillus reuszeri TaxID=54915 RepID=UPI001B1FD58F|nr:YcdB/YcdC domain-containing protein [Brevibacillus reuszeri]GIO10038.1 hypothetical protein J31TS6_60660 [Brevibacillus reuszeri]
MNSFEELEKQLKRLSELEQSPRPEYIFYLDEKLQKEAATVKLRIRNRRILTHTATAAAVILLGSWVSTMQWQQPSPQASTNPVNTNIASPSMSGLQPEAPAVSEKTPLAHEQAQTKPEVPASSAKPDVPETNTEQSIAVQQPPVHTSTEAADTPPLQIAQAYLNQMLGDESKDYVINTKQTDIKKGQIVFSRIIHGVPFYNDSYSVGIEHDAVSYFKFNRLPEKQRNLSKFPPPDHILSEKKAMEIIADTMQPVYRYDKNGVLSKRYELNFPGYLDAKTGNALITSDQSTQIPTPEMNIPVKAEGKKLEASSLNAVIHLLQEEFDVTFDGEQGTSPSSISYGNGWGTEYTWTGAEKTITATISPSGTLTAYHVQETKDEASTGSKRAPREDDQKKAVAYLQRYLDKKITAIGYLGSSWDEEEIHYGFGAFVDGIPIKGRTYSVTLDQNGKVAGMEVAKTASKNPPLSFNATSREAAISEYLTQHKLELIYIWPKKEADDKNASDAPQLVYQQK